MYNADNELGRRKERERQREEDEETLKSNFKKMLDSPWFTKGMLSDQEQKIIQKKVDNLNDTLGKFYEKADADVERLKEELEQKADIGEEERRKKKELNGAIWELRNQTVEYSKLFSMIWKDKGFKTYNEKKAELKKKEEELEKIKEELEKKENIVNTIDSQKDNAALNRDYYAREYSKVFAKIEREQNEVLSILDDAYRESVVGKSNINKAVKKFKGNLKRSDSSGGKNRRKTKKKRRKKRRKTRRSKKKRRKRRRTKKKRRRRR